MNELTLAGALNCGGYTYFNQDQLTTYLGVLVLGIFIGVGVSAFLFSYVGFSKSREAA